MTPLNASAPARRWPGWTCPPRSWRKARKTWPWRATRFAPLRRRWRRAAARFGALSLPWAEFQAAPLEIRRRLVVAALRFVTGSDYPPRRASVLQLLEALGPGARQTLDGAIIETRGAQLTVLREPAAAARNPDAIAGADGGAIWDGRWRLAGMAPGQQVRALGYAPLPDLDWRASGLSRDEAAASPAIWSGADLVAAPLLRPPADIRAEPLRGLGEFRAMLYTH